MKVHLINALLLVKIILKAGEALDGYIQTHLEVPHFHLIMALISYIVLFSHHSNMSIVLGLLHYEIFLNILKMCIIVHVIIN
jgi:hypothetical protein